MSFWSIFKGKLVMFLRLMHRFDTKQLEVKVKVQTVTVNNVGLVSFQT